MTAIQVHSDCTSRPWSCYGDTDLTPELIGSTIKSTFSTLINSLFFFLLIISLNNFEFIESIRENTGPFFSNRFKSIFENGTVFIRQTIEIESAIMESFKPSSEIVAYLSIWLPESGARVLLKQKAKTKEQKNFEVSWKGNY